MSVNRLLEYLQIMNAMLMFIENHKLNKSIEVALNILNFTANFIKTFRKIIVQSNLEIIFMLEI